MNPLSGTVLNEAISELELTPGMRVLDLGCGKGEALRRIVERYDVHGVGVDLSPYAIAQARAASMELRHGTLELIEGDALQYAPQSSFDAVLALGPGWAHDSFESLIRQTYPHALPGGLLLLADAFWRTEPTDEYMALLGVTRDEMGSHVGQRAGRDRARARPPVGGRRHSTRLGSLRVALPGQRRALGGRPRDHPQRAGFLERARAGRDRYLAGGREQLGFGIYLFRVPR